MPLIAFATHGLLQRKILFAAADLRDLAEHSRSIRFYCQRSIWTVSSLYSQNNTEGLEKQFSAVFI